MLSVIEEKIWRDGHKIAWIDGHHIKDEGGTKLGYIEGNYIKNESGYKVAYTEDDKLKFENGSESVPLERINEHVSGTVPLIMKCAIYALLER